MVRRDTPSRRNRRRRPDRGGHLATIPIDVEDRGDEYVVTADLPGVRKQDVDVRARKNRVQIVVDPSDGDAGGPFARRAGDHGPVTRTVRLPAWVNEQRASAEYLNGSLRLVLPKRRRITRVEVE